MNTKEFIDTLARSKNRRLRFQLPNERVLPVGYHLTEVKNIHVESVDCGGTANQWNETIIQLWIPKKLDPNHKMDAAKALKILRKADEIRPSDPEAICLFETDYEEETAIVYSPRQIKKTADALTIVLTGRPTECKALTREGPVSANACGQPASSCCA